MWQLPNQVWDLLGRLPTLHQFLAAISIDNSGEKFLEYFETNLTRIQPNNNSNKKIENNSFNWGFVYCSLRSNLRENERVNSTSISPYKSFMTPFSLLESSRAGLYRGGVTEWRMDGTLGPGRSEYAIGLLHHCPARLSMGCLFRRPSNYLLTLYGNH